jgi:SidE phosphodiesterase (PDE) domain
LGFDDRLIVTLEDIICHKEIDSSVNGFTGNTMLASQKLDLIKQVMNISHDVDLVRCRSWKSHFTNKQHLLTARHSDPKIKNFQFILQDQMGKLFNDTDAATNATAQLLELAKESCELTGTPVHYEGFSSRSKVDDYNKPIKDTKLKSLLPTDIRDGKLKDIKSKCIDDVGLLVGALQNLAGYFLSKNLVYRSESTMITSKL